MDCGQEDRAMEEPWPTWDPAWTPAGYEACDKLPDPPMGRWLPLETEQRANGSKTEVRCWATIHSQSS
jgi:hypothetical protein